MIFSVTYSQTEKDLIDIIEIIITESSTDTIDSFHKFDNQKLIDKFYEIKQKKNNQINKYYRTIIDSLGYEKYYKITNSKILPDSVTIDFEKMKFRFNSNFEKLIKKNNKRIRRIYKFYSLEKRNEQPLISFSYPIFSIEKNDAVVYFEYSGIKKSGHGIFIFNKENEKWKKVKTEYWSIM